MTRSRSRLVFVVAAALWLAACGPTAPPPAATTAPAANPTTAAARTHDSPGSPSPPPRQSPPHRKPRRPPKRRCQPTPPPPTSKSWSLPTTTPQDFTTLDFFESVYKRGSAGTAADLMSEPLIRINKNFEIVPAAAQSWSADSTDTVWTFKLDPNLMWSDDTPVTADDYVATFRYGADPQHAWDFAWFFGGVDQELGRRRGRQDARRSTRCYRRRRAHLPGDHAAARAVPARHDALQPVAAEEGPRGTRRPVQLRSCHVRLGRARSS